MSYTSLSLKYQIDLKNETILDVFSQVFFRGGQNLKFCSPKPDCRNIFAYLNHSSRQSRIYKKMLRELFFFRKPFLYWLL